MQKRMLNDPVFLTQMRQLHFYPSMPLKNLETSGHFRVTTVKCKIYFILSPVKHIYYSMK